MYIDTHCHLDFPQFNDDRAMVIGNAKKAGVKQFINPGVDFTSSKNIAEIAAKYPSIIFPCVGCHPYEAQKNIYPDDLEKLITPKTLAIGECGLDYHLYKGEKAAGKKDNQKRLFDSQLRMAIKRNLPVILHCRDAFEDLFSVLDQLPTLPSGIIHCFSGGLADLRMAKEHNLFIGIDGNVTYSNHLALIVPQIPLSQLLLETDAPYLTPVPHRGFRNEPKFIPLVAKKIAELQNISLKAVEDETTLNARTLFHIS